MVLGGADLQAALSLIHQVAAQDAVSQLPPVGALIETPSPVFSIEEMLARVDWLAPETAEADRMFVRLRVASWNRFRRIPWLER
jgi:signal transduction protein with GAF and PtsI domain